VQASLQHTPSAQKLLAQSEFAVHFWPCAHRVAQVLFVPPQSTSVSVPSFVMSLQFSVPPHPSVVLPHVIPCFAQVVGVQPHTFGVPPPPHVSYAGGWQFPSFVQGHWPWALHIWPLPHGVPMGLFVVVSVPFLHVYVAQGLVWGGTLVSSGWVVVPPLPSQTIFLQVPCACGGFEVVGVPAIVNAAVQSRVVMSQIGCWQSVVVPVHWLSIWHCLQSPLPSQMPGLLPMKVLHGAPSGWLVGECTAVPLLQLVSSQSLIGMGTSLSSMTLVSTPDMQTCVWQSPFIWVMPGVSDPSATFW
jgi:hypothetical protein